MSKEFTRISKIQPLIKSLYEASKEKLGFGPDAKIVILTNEDNSHNPLGKTAYYDPANHKIGLYTQGRHVKDVMRSLSHELVHHSQNCRGDFGGGIATVDGYAQEDGHLREMEREAYETGNLIFRDWEDNYKRNDNNKLFTDTSIMGEKLMEDKEAKLREVIKGLVREMLISVKQDAGESEVGLEEDSGEEEKKHYERDAGADEDHVEAIRHHLDALEHDKEYDEEHEEERKDENESFFPTTHDIREKAREQTHQSLMERWGYVKKEK